MARRRPKQEKVVVEDLPARGARTRRGGRREAEERDEQEQSDYAEAKRNQIGFWWTREREESLDEATVHEGVWATARFLREQQRVRVLDFLRWMRMYRRRLPLLDWLPNAADEETLDAPHPSFNVIRSTVDTLTAKIAKSRPKPTFLTTGGDWHEKRRAKKLDQFCQGQFYESKVHGLTPQVFRDACVLGTGAAKPYVQHGQMMLDRTLADELLVDEAEAMYGQPRQLHQVKSIAREVLLAQLEDWVEDARARAELYEKVRDSARPDEQLLPATQRRLGDMVGVIESWHLPSAPGVGDGRHVIAVDNATLVDEGWRWGEFPFVFHRLAKPMLGFWGDGLAEQLEDLQVEMDRLLAQIAEIIDLTAVPVTWIPRGAKVKKKHVTNEIGNLIEYTGAIPPKRDFLGSVPPELFAQLDRIYAKAYEIAGISQLSANARKPVGLDSAPSLREYNDIESERFVVTGQDYEQLHLDIARWQIRLAPEIDDYKVRRPSRKSVQVLAWKDVSLEDSKYVMQMFPTSSLPTTPAAKKQAVEEMWQAGWIDATEARQLLDYPDLESSANIAFAAREDIEAQIDRMLDSGKYEPPEPYQDLKWGVPRMQAEYLRARGDGAPEEILEILRQWIDEGQDLLAKATPPPQSDAAMPGAAPPVPAGMPIPPAAAMPIAPLASPTVPPVVQ